ncbi:ABC transporter permease [Bacillota bacterium Meth-B3]|nr:ABC transporter permease [Christensenellaceae bacterium]MEA5067040.1 ABC transporter permease [Eubacteriales bacterium]
MKAQRRRVIAGDKLILLAAIAMVTALFSFLNRNYFGVVNLINILVASSLVGLVAIGHTYLIIAGQNDLSPGSVAAFSGVLAALLMQMGMNLPLTIVITLVAGALIGAFNAFMVNKIKLQAFIATLVTQSIVRGFAYILCGGKPIAIADKNFIALGKLRFPDLSPLGVDFAGIPLAVWIMLIAFSLFGFMLAKTRFGRSIYVIGGNQDAARLAGLNPHRIVLTAFMMMGVMCALGGIVFAARMNSGQPAANVNLEFDAITAVILGGVSFSGGMGTMGGTLLGVLLIQAFNTGLTMVQVDSFWQFVARGALLFFALTTDYLRKRNHARQLLEASKRNG